MRVNYKKKIKKKLTRREGKKRTRKKEGTQTK